MVLFVKELFFSTSVTYLNTKKKKKNFQFPREVNIKIRKVLYHVTTRDIFFSC